MRFTPCAGRDFCTEEGTHCRGCGRSHEEIARTRALLTALVDAAVVYENAGEFLDYLRDKATKGVERRRADAART